MSPEQELLTKWRSLPQDKQEEVLDFVEFLHWKTKLKEKEKIQPTIPEGKGQNSDFFEQTAGCLADDAIQRYPQGEYEEREPLE
jgi:hypothetical protein